MNAVSGRGGHPFVTANRLNSLWSSAWAVTYARRNVSQWSGSPVDRPENAGGSTGSAISSGLQETMRTHGTFAVRTAGNATTLSWTITSGLTDSKIAVSRSFT